MFPLKLPFSFLQPLLAISQIFSELLVNNIYYSNIYFIGNGRKSKTLLLRNTLFIAREQSFTKAKRQCNKIICMYSCPKFFPSFFAEMLYRNLMKFSSFIEEWMEKLTEVWSLKYFVYSRYSLLFLADFFI